MGQQKPDKKLKWPFLICTCSSLYFSWLHVPWPKQYKPTIILRKIEIAVFEMHKFFAASKLGLCSMANVIYANDNLKKN